MLLYGFIVKIVKDLNFALFINLIVYKIIINFMILT